MTFFVDLEVIQCTQIPIFQLYLPYILNMKYTVYGRQFARKM